VVGQLGRLSVDLEPAWVITLPTVRR